MIYRTVPLRSLAGNPPSSEFYTSQTEGHVEYFGFEQRDAAEKEKATGLYRY